MMIAQGKFVQSARRVDPTLSRIRSVGRVRYPDDLCIVDHMPYIEILDRRFTTECLPESFLKLG